MTLSLNPPLQRFFAWNRDICLRIDERLSPSFNKRLRARYSDTVANYINVAEQATVLDIGGGKECPYRRQVADFARHAIIAVDISEAEIRQNTDCRLKVVARADGENLPFEPNSVDAISSRSVIEHLRDNAAFFRACHRVLKPGGYFIHLLPCRFSPFSIMNKMLPDRIARAILYFFQPSWREACGFKVYYDHCSYREMRDLIERSGYELVQYELRYYQAIYFTFFVPLYLLVLLYDLMLHASGIKNLSSQMLFVARKRERNAA